MSICDKDSNEPIAAFVNLDTGEITTKLYEGDKVKITTKLESDKARKLLKKKEEEDSQYDTKFNEGESFVKLYDKVVKVLRKHLSSSEFVFVMSLSEFVCYDDCILRNEGRKDRKALTAKDLSVILELSESVVRRTIASLVNKGVLGIHKTGSIDSPKVLTKKITVNPWIFMRGHKMDRTVISFYSDSGWKKLLDM